MRCKALLFGQEDCLAFVTKAKSFKNLEIYLVSGNGKYRVNGKSILGCLMAVSEWGNDIWIEMDGDYYFDFEDWIETAADDAANIHE